MWGCPAHEGARPDHNPRSRNLQPYPLRRGRVGGGVKGGAALGGAADFGHAAVEGKAHVHGLYATILNLLGLDHSRLTCFHGGRDMRLTDVIGGCCG